MSTSLSDSISIKSKHDINNKSSLSNKRQIDRNEYYCNVCDYSSNISSNVTRHAHSLHAPWNETQWRIDNNVSYKKKKSKHNNNNNSDNDYIDNNNSNIDYNSGDTTNTTTIHNNKKLKHMYPQSNSKVISSNNKNKNNNKSNKTSSNNNNDDDIEYKPLVIKKQHNNSSDNNDNNTTTNNTSTSPRHNNATELGVRAARLKTIQNQQEQQQAKKNNNTLQVIDDDGNIDSVVLNRWRRRTFTYIEKTIQHEELQATSKRKSSRVGQLYSAELPQLLNQEQIVIDKQRSSDNGLVTFDINVAPFPAWRTLYVSNHIRTHNNHIHNNNNTTTINKNKQTTYNIYNRFTKDYDTDETTPILLSIHRIFRTLNERLAKQQSISNKYNNFDKSAIRMITRHIHDNIQKQLDNNDLIQTDFNIYNDVMNHDQLFNGNNDIQLIITPKQLLSPKSKQLDKDSNSTSITTQQHTNKKYNNSNDKSTQQQHNNNTTSNQNIKKKPSPKTSPSSKLSNNNINTIDNKSTQSVTNNTTKTNTTTSSTERVIPANGKHTVRIVVEHSDTIQDRLSRCSMTTLVTHFIR